MVHAANKGKAGEQDIARRMNDIVEEEYVKAHGALPEGWVTTVQRNQNQSAVGGDDLVGTFNFSIEIKNQKELSLNTWWKQSIASAARQGKQPVLIYKVFRKGWEVLMGGAIKHEAMNGRPAVYARCSRLQVSLDDFLDLWREVVRQSL